MTAPESRPVGAHRAPETTVDRPRTKYQPLRYRPELDPATAEAVQAEAAKARHVDAYMRRITDLARRTAS